MRKRALMLGELVGFACVVLALSLVDPRLGLGLFGAGLVVASWALDE